MENKYLRDIKDLNDSFDEYKKQVEKHIAQVTQEKTKALKDFEEAETVINKMKQTLRSNTSHHELNSKRLREKLARAENELCARNDESSKLRAKNNQLKTSIIKMEYAEKKLRTLIFNKESLI